MEQIYLISATAKETENWSKLIELAGNANIQVLDFTQNTKIENLKAISTGIAWVVGSGMQPDVLDRIVKHCQGNSIPVVCTDCSHIRNYSVQYLISMGVKAIVNLHFSVLRIKEVMDIVYGGGIYMQNFKNQI